MAVRWLSLLLAAYCCLYGLSNAAVISIDFGSEWIKVALVKPGVPMEIVLNKESKRKTAAVVSLRNNDRAFGDPALNVAVKYPKNAYRYLQLLVAQKFDSPIVQKYREWFPFYDLRKDEERGTVLFQHDQDTVYSVEELVAMMFNNSRHIAEAYAGVPIRDAVITVPPFFNQAQRREIIGIASLVGLNVLQLMSDNAAAALNYGLFRQSSFNTTPHYIMFYDMGASSTTATIVEYRKVQVKEGTLANVHPQLSVKGTGFNLFLGGLEMDIRLQQHLAAAFQEQKKTQGSVYDSPRAMAKLLKEAKRVKQVLSANTDHYAQIEGLLEDVDFRTKVTRAEFEEMCTDLLNLVGDPVNQALQSADITMEEIESVVLVGGGTRVPKVQEILLKKVNKPELGKSLNTDEAIAMGAVYQGAGHTKLFRVKKFIVKEGTVYPIQVAFSRIARSSDGEVEEEEEVVKTVRRTLFQRSNPYPAKKVLTFNRHASDFSFQVFYGDLGFLSAEEKGYLGRLNISEVYLAGVGEALTQHSQGEAKGIKAHFNMDESGLLNLTFAESVFEYPEDAEEQSTLSKIGSTISNFFGMGNADSADEDAPLGEGEEVPTDGNETESSAGTKDSAERSEQQAEDDVAETNTASDSEKPDTETAEPELEDEEEIFEEPTEEPAVETEEEEEEPIEEPPLATEEGEEPPIATEGDEPPIATEEGEEPPIATEEGQEPSLATEEGEEEPAEGASSEPNVTASNLTNGTLSNDTSGGGSSKKGKASPKGSVVRVNLTAEVTTLDLAPLSRAATTLAVEKLVILHGIDMDKVANEKAKNSLESHVFETKDAMYSEVVVAVSTEEQREVVTAALNDASDWLDDEGYTAKTKVYKDKLKDLKKVSRALFKRVSEAGKRPKLLASFKSSLNISHDFLSRMKNLSSEVQIFTEVEITSLEDLVKEAEQWIEKKLADQEITPPHEEPAIMAYEIEDHIKRLDREIMYLLNKLRSHPPPNLKVPANKTNGTTKDSRAKSKPETPSEEPPAGAPPSPEGTTPIRDEATPSEEANAIPTIPEPLELDGSEPLTSEGLSEDAQGSEEPHLEL